jgi:hypothetical protein
VPRAAYQASLDEEVPGGIIPGIKTDQVKVTRSLGRNARFHSRMLWLASNLSTVLSSRDDAAKYKDLQHFILITSYQYSWKEKLFHPRLHLKTCRSRKVLRKQGEIVEISR